MADADNTEGEENTTPPPTEEEKQTETVDDQVQPKPEPETEPEGPDVSARLDALEKELAALKAMLDTLGYTEPVTEDNDGDGDGNRELIEDLFD